MFDYIGSVLETHNIFLLAVFLAGGLYILIRGGGSLIKGAEALSRSYNIDSFIIGLTVVAFGTSLPELFVSFMANLSDRGDIGIGNIIGSNICNIALVLGIGAIIRPVMMRVSTLKVDLPIVFVVSAVFYVMMLDLKVSRMEGVMMTVMFAGYIYYIYKRAKLKNEELLDEDEIPHGLSRTREVVMIIMGIIGLYIGSEFTIRGASGIARAVGVSELAIGLTIVSIGTSLPELVATLQALKMNNPNIGVANIIGSNVFNILFVMGLSASTKPFPVNPDNIKFWGPLMLFVTLILFPMGYKKSKDHKIYRSSGILLLILYLCYLVLSFVIKGT